MNVDTSVIVAFMTALAVLGTFILGAIRFVKPSADKREEGQAKFQDRLIADNKNLWDRVNRIQDELDECESGRRTLQSTVDDLMRRLNGVERKLGGAP